MTNTSPAAVERFDMVRTRSGGVDIRQSDKGVWVVHSDYAALSAQLDAANQRHAAALDAVALANKRADAASKISDGICDFIRLHRVTTYTSGNELQGPPVFYGDYKTARDAEQALADDGYTRKEWGWRKGYSEACISEIVQYENYRCALRDQPSAGEKP